MEKGCEKKVMCTEIITETALDWLKNKRDRKNHFVCCIIRKHHIVNGCLLKNIKAVYKNEV